MIYDEGGIWGSPVSRKTLVTAVTLTIRENGSHSMRIAHAQRTAPPISHQIEMQ